MALAFGIVCTPGYNGISFDGVLVKVVGCIEVELALQLRYLNSLVVGRCRCLALSYVLLGERLLTINLAEWQSTEIASLWVEDRNVMLLVHWSVNGILALATRKTHRPLYTLR